MQHSFSKAYLKDAKESDDCVESIVLSFWKSGVNGVF